MTRVINSAALYFGQSSVVRVPSSWLSHAVELFNSHGLSIDYFDISATQVFDQENVYPFANYKEQLAVAVDSGAVEAVGLYSNPDVKAPKSDWRALVSLEMDNGMMFLGVDDNVVSDQEELLRYAYATTPDLNVTYGMSYKTSLKNGPESYAAGILCGSVADLEMWFSSKDQIASSLAVWRNEKYGKRRYLTSMFRGAYCASIVSNQHLSCIKGCNNGKQMPGQFIPLVESQLWIWKLASTEIAEAEERLRNCGLVLY